MGDLAEVDETLDLAGVRRAFVSNVGGAGMSAVATLLSERGHRVVGSDPAPHTPFVELLRSLGVELHLGGAEAGLDDDVDAVVVSTATPAAAPEVVTARERGVPVVHRRAALAGLSAERTTVAVAGTHGKTTTSALLATVLDGAGTEPGWVVGAPIPGLGRSATWGGAGPLVVEADESDGTFLALHTDVALVTNIEPDHLEHYGSFEGLVGSFERFLAAAQGPAVVSADDELALRSGRAVGATSVGLSAEADIQIVDVCPAGSGPDAAVAAASSSEAPVLGASFALVRNGERLVEATVALPGAHNVQNAAMALVAAEALGVPWAEGARALAGFAGVARRFEVRGRALGATLVDDYAHLPGEVAAALEAASNGWRRVVCVFQPHRYSRTEAHWAEFARSFDGADLLAVTDVYAAGEAPRTDVSGKLIVDGVLDADPWRHVAYLPQLDDVVRWLQVTLRPGDLCLTLGAGDLTTVPDRLMELASAGGAGESGEAGEAGDSW